jgi:hypothetical protein
MQTAPRSHNFPTSRLPPEAVAERIAESDMVNGVSPPQTCYRMMMAGYQCGVGLALVVSISLGRINATTAQEIVTSGPGTMLKRCVAKRVVFFWLVRSTGVVVEGEIDWGERVEDGDVGAFGWVGEVGNSGNYVWVTFDLGGLGSWEGHTACVPMCIYIMQVYMCVEEVM